MKFNPMEVRSGTLYGGFSAKFSNEKLVEIFIHYEKLKESVGKLELPLRKCCNTVNEIDGGHVMGNDKQSSSNIIPKRVKGTGRIFYVERGYGFIETEKTLDYLKAQRVSRDINI